MNGIFRRRSRIFKKKSASDAVVWAAFCERSYEGIGFMRVIFCVGYKAKADVRSTTKNAHTQVNEHFL